MLFGKGIMIRTHMTPTASIIIDQIIDQIAFWVEYVAHRMTGARHFRT